MPDANFSTTGEETHKRTEGEVSQTDSGRQYDREPHTATVCCRAERGTGAEQYTGPAFISRFASLKERHKRMYLMGAFHGLAEYLSR